jgi:DNA-directed RNA polymerase specialized sigma24 family protein
MSEEGMPPASSAGEDGSMEGHVPRLESSLSAAFLSVMESLTPAERTVFLLQKASGFDHTKVAFFVGESEASCSRLVRRAKRSVVARRPRFENWSERKEEPE